MVMAMNPMRRAFLILAATALAAGAAYARPLAVDDLYRLEHVVESQLSPDGKRVAYVRQRPGEITHHLASDDDWGNDRADIWIEDLASHTVERITNGAE